MATIVVDRATLTQPKLGAGDEGGCHGGKRSRYRRACWARLISRRAARVVRRRPSCGHNAERRLARHHDPLHESLVFAPGRWWLGRARLLGAARLLGVDFASSARGGARGHNAEWLARRHLQSLVFAPSLWWLGRRARL